MQKSILLFCLCEIFIQNKQITHISMNKKNYFQKMFQTESDVCKCMYSIQLCNKMCDAKFVHEKLIERKREKKIYMYINIVERRAAVCWCSFALLAAIALKQYTVAREKNKINFGGRKKKIIRANMQNVAYAAHTLHV